MVFGNALVPHGLLLYVCTEALGTCTEHWTAVRFIFFVPKGVEVAGVPIAAFLKSGGVVALHL